MNRRGRGERAAGGHAREDSYEDDSYDHDENTADDRETLRTRRERAREAGGGPRRLTAATAGRVALRHIADLTGKDVEGVTLVKPAGDGWTVEVEVVEDHRIPSSGDTLGIYAADLDSEGDLVSYRRVRTYKRARGDTGGVY
ncbi:gas vesicle protein [Sphaerisporangium album]|uniref:Gas vesicle protein n=1 Tax=Sphaerisporangium album TaxID=509200 RepID=A0A367FJG4_9ACTN|nr:gas vesicle protein [Sphaerisporangium album]